MNYIKKWFTSLPIIQESKTSNKNLILAKVFEAMCYEDVKSQANIIHELYSWSFYSPDLSFLGENIITMLGSSDPFVINTAFQAASLFLTSKSRDVDLFPSVLIKAFKNPLTLNSALNALTFLINPYIYHAIRSELIEIASSSTDIARKYALTSVFVAYKRDISKLYLPDLLLLLRKAIFVPALRYTAASIYVKLLKMHQYIQNYLNLPKLLLQIFHFPHIIFFQNLHCIYDVFYLHLQILLRTLNNNLKLLLLAIQFLLVNMEILIQEFRN